MSGNKTELGSPEQCVDTAELCMQQSREELFISPESSVIAVINLFTFYNTASRQNIPPVWEPFK